MVAVEDILRVLNMLRQRADARTVPDDPAYINFAVGVSHAYGEVAVLIEEMLGVEAPARPPHQQEKLDNPPGLQT